MQLALNSLYDSLDEATALLTNISNALDSPHSLDDDDARHGISLVVGEIHRRLKLATTLINAARVPATLSG